MDDSFTPSILLVLILNFDILSKNFRRIFKPQILVFLLNHWINRMELKKNFRNELFNRQEIMFDVESDKTPNFPEMKNKIAEEFSKPEENINVFNIKGNFGKKVFSIHAYVYDSKNDLDKAVQKTKKQRDAEKKAIEEKASSVAAEEKVKADAEAKKAEETSKAEAE